MSTVNTERAKFGYLLELSQEQIEALEIRLVGTEAENGWLDTRYQNLQTDMEVLKKERDSLQAKLQRWYEASGSVGALRPRS